MEDLEKKSFHKIKIGLSLGAMAALFVFAFYQITVPIEGLQGANEVVSSPITAMILTLAVSFFGIWFVIYLLRKILHHQTKISSSFKNVILLVTLPKESAEKAQAQEKREITVQTIQENIAAAEALFASVGGLKAQKGIGAWLAGRTDHLSFEIVADKGLISFYVAVPKNLAGIC